MARFVLTLIVSVLLATSITVGVAAQQKSAQQKSAQPKAGAPDGQQSAIRDVIRSQLNAFLKDDGPGAYRFASPMIQMMFPDPGRFMQMVQRAYRPVYRSRNVQFRRFGAVSGRLVQEIHLTGPDGTRYAACYFMQKQKDGTWRINGVRLVKLPGAV